MYEMTRSKKSALGSVICILGFSLVALEGCSDGTDGEDDSGTDTESETDNDQEESMCATLDGTTGNIVISGQTLGQGGAMNPGVGLKEISLSDAGGGMEGYVEIQAVAATELLMLVREAAPIEILDSDGDQVSDVEFTQTPEPCPGAEGGRYFWQVANPNNHLHFGPTSLSEVHIALETVQ